MSSVKEKEETVENWPETVYKYRTWSELHKTILTSQVVFMAKPSSFEDPLDCKLQKRYDLLTQGEIFHKYLQESLESNPNFSPEEHRQFAQYWYERSPLHDKKSISKQQEQDFAEFDSRFGVLSLTEYPLEGEMWKKYADNHQGLCIGFHCELFFKHLGGGGKVVYSDQLPIIHPFDSFETEHGKQVFSKLRKWEFEKEYRTHKFYPSPASVSDRLITVPKECYREIIIGQRMGEKAIAEILEVVRENSLPVSIRKVVEVKGELSLLDIA